MNKSGSFSGGISDISSFWHAKKINNPVKNEPHFFIVLLIQYHQFFNNYWLVILIQVNQIYAGF